MMIEMFQDVFFFYLFHRYSLCQTCSSPKVDVPPFCQLQWRKILFLRQTSENEATISSWHREDCKLTVYNPDLCHSNNYYSHWSILDKTNSNNLDNADKYGSWTSQKTRGGFGKTVEQIMLSQWKFSSFSSVSPENLMWKREKTRVFSPCSPVMQAL